jgi:hypothetical protein
MDAVVKTFAKIAADTNCAIDLDHHTRKLAPGQSEVTIEDARGRRCHPPAPYGH